MVSIIVPVYKVERCLPRCVESLINQTYKDIEIILVDDGSPDNSPKICDYYAEKDSRIKVIHKQNGGVSSARNTALDVASGEYITFVDSDDWVEHQMIEYMVNAIDGVDIVGVNFDSRAISVGRNILEEGKFNLKEDKKSNFLYNVAPWGKLYKTSIIKQNNIRFLEYVKYGEDAIFLYDYIFFAKSAYAVDKILYHYNCFMNSGSKTFYEDRAKWSKISLEKYKKCFEDSSNAQRIKAILSSMATTSFINCLNMWVTNCKKEKAINGMESVYNTYAEFIKDSQNQVVLLCKDKKYLEAYKIIKKSASKIKARAFFKKALYKTIYKFVEVKRDGIIKLEKIWKKLEF